MARERLTYLLTAVFVWVCACHAQNPPLPPPLPASEPATVGELCRLTPAGTTEALDRVKMKKETVKYGPVVHQYRIYIEGEASSVVFKPGEAQVLAVRLLAPGDRWGKETTPEELQRHLSHVTRLYVQDGKRFLTKLQVPFEVRSYGNPTPGLDSKKPDRLASSFQLIPRQTLPPGEYAVFIAGTHNGELVGNMLAGREYFTFGVAER